MATEVRPDLVTLRMPDLGPEEGPEDPLRNLDYGPLTKTAQGYLETNIRFMEGVAIVRSDHPLLPDLLARYPMIRVIGDADGPQPGQKVYACPTCNREFSSRQAARMHARVHKDGDEEPEE